MLDAEDHIVGTITAYARKTATSSIRSVSVGAKDYAGVLSKAGRNASLYEDWMGDSYLGVRGKSGETPESVINAETGEVQTEIQEPTDEEIIASLMELFSAFAAPDMTALDISEDDPLYADIQAALENNDMFLQLPEDIEDSLYVALSKKNEQTDAFWTALDEFMPDIESITDEEEILDASGKGLFSSIVGAIVNAVVKLFTGVDDEVKYIEGTSKNFSFWRSSSDVALQSFTV